MEEETKDNGFATLKATPSIIEELNTIVILMCSLSQIDNAKIKQKSEELILVALDKIEIELKKE